MQTGYKRSTSKPRAASHSPENLAVLGANRDPSCVCPVLSVIISRAVELEDPNGVDEAFAFVSRFLDSVDSCESDQFDDSFLALCEQYGDSERRRAKDLIAQIIRKGLRKCASLAEPFWASGLPGILSECLDLPSVVAVFSELIGLSPQLNQAMIESGLFEAILGLKDGDLMAEKLYFCSRFIATCDPADFSRITQVLAFLSGAFPPMDAQLLAGCAHALTSAIFCSPLHAMRFLAATSLFRQVYFLLEKAVNSSVLRWCLRLINFGTSVRDFDVAMVRELFPIGPLLTISVIDDAQAQEEFLSIFVNFMGHAVYSMAELGTPFMCELIGTFIFEGTSEQKRQIFSILHNLVNLASREELAEFASPEILEAYFDHFMSMDGMKDKTLLQSLGTYVNLALDVPGFDFTLLRKYLDDIDEPLRGMAQYVVNLIDERLEQYQ
jgi:hypothetical protein